MKEMWKTPGKADRSSDYDHAAQKDQYGESFAHEVNGKAFFAMGADYIPEEHLLGRRCEEKTRRLLEDCRLANFNVIRVWGGGFYPDDWFLIFVMSWAW